jgi:RNA polymerase sigma factor (sigma-70 family)
MTLASTDDRDALNGLLAATAQRDQRAFAELYRRTSPKLYGICVRVLRSRSEADEVLQDVYTSVWNRAATFDAAKAGALTWLATLARNRAIDRLRQHRDDARESAEIDEHVDDDATPALDAERSQEHRRLAECMDKLESTQRRSVREAFFTGATYSELATRLGVPLGTMKSWIRRSLIQLRACLEA